MVIYKVDNITLIFSHCYIFVKQIPVKPTLGRSLCKTVLRSETILGNGFVKPSLKRFHEITPLKMIAPPRLVLSQPLLNETNPVKPPLNFYGILCWRCCWIHKDQDKLFCTEGSIPDQNNPLSSPNKSWPKMNHFYIEIFLTSQNKSQLAFSSADTWLVLFFSVTALQIPKKCRLIHYRFTCQTPVWFLMN